MHGAWYVVAAIDVCPLYDNIIYQTLLGTSKKISKFLTFFKHMFKKFSRLLLTMHNAQCTEPTVHSTTYIAQCTLYVVLYNKAQCTLYNVQNLLHDAQCTMHTVRCTLYTVRCTVQCTVRCTLYAVRCYRERCTLYVVHCV